MSNQVRILVGSHTDFCLFATNSALISVLRKNFDEVLDFNIQNQYLGRHLKNRLSLLWADANYFINGWTTLVNTKGEVLIPEGRTVKTKKMLLLINFPAKAKICVMFISYIDMMIPALQVEFRQVVFTTFQIILKTIPINKFCFAFKKMTIYIYEV